MKAMRIVMERRGGIVAPVAMPRTQTIIPRSEPTRSRAVQNDVERRPQSFQPAFMINRRIQFNVSIFALKSLPFRSGIDGCLRASPSNSSPASLFPRWRVGAFGRLFMDSRRTFGVIAQA
jgi:hypothetical protein